jgi:tetratricopeptide (TPR) repeat protein
MVGRTASRPASVPLRAPYFALRAAAQRLAPIACVLAVLLVARQAVVMPASVPGRHMPRRIHAVPPAVRKPFSAAAERNYRFRLRQLESDLARDPREYLLLARLGTLHARLSEHAPTYPQAELDLKAALALFERAARYAQTRRDYEWAMAQREAYKDGTSANDDTDAYLHPDLIASPPAPSDIVRDQLLLRTQFLEMLVKEMPASARLYCRLGLTYVRLGQALAWRSREEERRGDGETGRRGEGTAFAIAPRRPVASSPHLVPDGLPVEEPTAVDCRRRAREALASALRLARCREVRAESYRALAELYRAAGDPVSCLGMLRRVVELQPNNWPAQLRVAATLTRLGRPEDARRAQAMGERWRTPEWM